MVFDNIFTIFDNILTIFDEPSKYEEGLIVHLTGDVVGHDVPHVHQSQHLRATTFKFKFKCV